MQKIVINLTTNQIKSYFDKNIKKIYYEKIIYKRNREIDLETKIGNLKTEKLFRKDFDDLENI